VVAASPKSGINTITGEGLKEAMAGAQAVGDPRGVVSDSEAEYFGSRVEERSLVPSARRASVASVSTNGSAAHGQESDPPSDNQRRCSMKRILCSLLVATRPFGSVLAARIACRRLKAEDCESLEKREPLRRTSALALSF
jgi:hypothetical protein